MQPSTRSILEIVSILDDGVRAAQAFPDLHQRLLPALSAAFPSGTKIWFYWLDNDRLRLGAASSPAAEDTPQEDWLALAFTDDALLHRDSRWLLPLLCDGKITGVLAVQLLQDAPDNFEALLESIRSLIAQAQTLLFVNDLSARQMRASEQLQQAHTFPEMAHAVATHMLRSAGQFIAISLLETDSSGRVIGFRTIASANTRQAFDSEAVYHFPDGSIRPEMLALTTQEAAYLSVRDVFDDERVDDQYREWLTRLRIHAMCLLPLRSEGHVFGILAINHVDTPDELTPRERSAYQMLGDQIGALVQVNHLITETRSSKSQAEIALELLQAQYEITSQIHGTDSAAEMLAAVYAFTGGRFARATMGLAQGDLLDIIAEVDAKGWREAHYQADLRQYPAYETLSAVETFPIENVPIASLLSDEEKARLQERGVAAFVIVPLLVERRFAGMIMLEHPTPQSLPHERLRALRGIVDQVAVKLENQRLLRSMEQNLREVSMLYETNRALLNAQDSLDVLRALRDSLAPDALSIAQMSVTRDEQKQISDLRLRYRIAGAEEQVMDMSLKGAMSPTALLEASRLWDDPDYTTTFIEDISKDYLSGLMRQLFEVRGVHSTINLLFHQGNLVRDIISVTFAETRAFDEGIRRLYSAIHTQIEVVLHVQSLNYETQVNAAQLADQVRVLEAINTLAATTTTLRDETALLEAACRAFVTALEVNKANALLLTENRQSVVVATTYPDRGQIGDRFALHPTTLLNLALQERTAVAWNTVDAQTTLGAAERVRLSTSGVKSLLIVPLIDLQQQPIGGIELEIHTGRIFTQEMIDIAQTLTQQIAVTLQNIRLLHDTGRRAQQLEQIATFSQSVQATLEIAAILEIALQSCSRMLPLEYMGVAFYDSASAGLHLVARMFEGKPYVNPRDAALLDMNGTVVGEVWRERRVVDVPDVASDRMLKYTHPFMEGALMVAPVFLRGMARGTVEIATRTAYAYGTADAAMFQQFVTQLAVALENAEAFDESQRLAQNKALANEISTHLQQQPNLDGMINLTVKELGRALGARRARIRLNTETMRSEE